MIDQDIIAPVTEPTASVNSMVVAKKKNNAIRICFDPRELNKAVKWSHYPMPTVEEVATNLSNAKVFTVLDAHSGFWQIKLDEASSHLTTFNSPFGRYRWRRLPFGIKSAPEEWQRCTIETITMDYLASTSFMMIFWSLGQEGHSLKPLRIMTRT